MSTDLLLKPSCGGCGSTSDLYGSNCKHMTLCSACGKTMAENKAKCYDCGAIVTRLIREYNVRASTTSDKTYFIGRFVTGLPNFSKKKNAENKWSLRKDLSDPRRNKDKDGPDQKKYKDVRPPTDASREKHKNKPWVLEDETGQSQYQGQLEGAQSAIYYLLTKQGKEFTAIPAGSWFNFNKVAQYKQLTLEEAEEKMNNRKKTQDGYERWMMKSGHNGAAAFGEKDTGVVGVAGGKGRKKMTGDDDEGNFSDKGEEDEEEEIARKNRLGLNKKGGDDEDDEGANEDEDLDDDSSEKGDDWEHEEIFTDDDEAVGINPEEREEFEPEVPAPPEIKQDDDDDDANEEEGGLSKSGKELKKLLGRSGGLNDSDAEDDDDDDDDMDDDIALPQAVAPKQKDAPKQEPVDNSPIKPGTSGSAARANSSASKSAKGKRKLNGDDAKASNSAPPKKEQKSVKEEPASDNCVPAKGTTASLKTGSTPLGVPAGPVSEEEIRAVLMQKSPITTRDLVNNFPGRLKSKEEKDAFAAILRKMSRIQKNNGISYVVLREK